MPFNRFARTAALLQEHFGTVAADRGHHTTFRTEHIQGIGSAKEEVMGEKWRERMRFHEKIERVMGKLEPEERATLYHAFSTERWPEPLQTVFWSSQMNQCIAGVVMALPHTIAAAESSKSKTAGTWLRKAIRIPEMKPPLLFLLRRAELETRIALDAFQEAWNEEEKTS